MLLAVFVFFRFVLLTQFEGKKKQNGMQTLKKTIRRRNNQAHLGWLMLF